MSDLIFSRWFARILSDKRMTASELADRARMSKASLYFYLSGARIPDQDSVLKLCAALRVDPSTVPEFERRKVGQPAHKQAVTR